MPEVHQITIQLEPPTANDPGQVSTGYYTVEDGLLTMVYPDGIPVGEEFTCQLRDGMNIRAIASVMTRRVRRHLRGQNEAQERFGRRITTDTGGVA